ncbi:hypothetical protein Bbelb_365760 [Branchiostoma belcheri]|nr:hypothetical protein Bbelb_365760 [Branchiostoma belcheri]
MAATAHAINWEQTGYQQGTTRTARDCPYNKMPPVSRSQSLRHVLNACPVSLTDRYTWRHNSVLKELVTTLQGWYSTLEAAVTIRVSLSPDVLEGGTHTTLHPDILPTYLLPGITIPWR